MVRQFTIAMLGAIGVVLGAPGGAQARVACPSETATATVATMAAVSDAVFCLTNQIRTSYGLPAFRRDTRLDIAARLHSADMATRNTFAHTNLDGLDPTQRAALQGYASGVGENIAYGYANARAVVLGWMSSAGHCRNILGQAREIGVGSANPGRTYYTQDFGDYDWNASEAAAGGCPITVNLDTLVVPDSPSANPGGAGQAAAVKTPPVATSAAAPALAPVLGRLGLSTARVRSSGRGTTVSFTLTAPATVTFGLDRVLDGRRVGGRCVVASASTRGGGRCTRYKEVAGNLSADGRQGANRVRIRARAAGRRLASGRYRLRAIATDASGDASAERRVRLRVVRG